MEKRLAFFEKDLIPWRSSEFASFYQQLFRLKREQEALGMAWTVARLSGYHLATRSLFAFLRKRNEQPSVVDLQSQRPTDQARFPEIKTCSAEAPIRSWETAVDRKRLPIELPPGVGGSWRPRDHRDHRRASNRDLHRQILVGPGDPESFPRKNTDFSAMRQRLHRSPSSLPVLLCLSWRG